jgi:probable HAF family extracellular repeat protein
LVGLRDKQYSKAWAKSDLRRCHFLLDFGRSSAVKPVRCGVVALGVLEALAGPAKADWVFATLDVPGATDTLAYGIKASGQIAGEYWDAASKSRGFLFDNGNFSSLDVLGSNKTAAVAINDSGPIVGN